MRYRIRPADDDMKAAVLAGALPLTPERVMSWPKVGLVPAGRRVPGPRALPAQGDRPVELFVTHVEGEHGSVWVGEGADAPVAAAAVWAADSPESCGDVLAGLEEELPAITGGHRATFERSERELAPYRPTGPLWTLVAVGAEESRCPEGWGSTVLAPGLRRTDDDGVPAWRRPTSTICPATVHLASRRRPAQPPCPTAVPGPGA